MCSQSMYFDHVSVKLCSSFTQVSFCVAPHALFKRTAELWVRPKSVRLHGCELTSLCIDRSLPTAVHVVRWHFLTALHSCNFSRPTASSHASTLRDSHLSESYQAVHIHSYVVPVISLASFAVYVLLVGWLLLLFRFYHLLMMFSGCLIIFATILQIWCSFDAPVLTNTFISAAHSGGEPPALLVP